MTRIVFIGGGSAQWTPGLVSDIALTETLRSDIDLVLHDINAEALKTMVPLCRQIVAQLGADIRVTATLDRAKALQNADFVVFCVGVGGLRALRNDLEIPEKYGIYQAVGDTVGPGGLSRALRHIPVAVDIAREMESLCPEAWLINLTNPMTTICRAITKATQIRTVGLCHEVGGMRANLAGLFQVPTEGVHFTVGGINHLPIILNCGICDQEGCRDGLTMLRDWLSQNDPFAFVNDQEPSSVFEVFLDAMALKLDLFQQLDILFGAGDRHVAEFLPGVLTEATDRGRHYGIILTTTEHREAMLRQRIADLDNFEVPKEASDEQLAPLIAALLDGPSAQFVVNVPNRGQIDNLPRDAVVECMAHADALGIHPLAVGALPPAAHAIVAPHVDRQELIVEATLTGDYDLAKAALSSDPLIRDPQTVAPLFEDLLAANGEIQQAMNAKAEPWDFEAQEAELEILNAQPMPDVVPEAVPIAQGNEAPNARERIVQTLKRVPFLQGLFTAKKTSPPTSGFSVEHSTLRELLQDDDARAILERHFPDMIHHPQLRMAMGMTLSAVARYAPKTLTEEKLAQVEADLTKLSPKVGR